jgi:hypothetical protein
MEGEMTNVGWVHPDAMKPDRAYFNRPLDWFVGRSVKIAFRSAGTLVELMWVGITGIEGDRLVGVLDNVPVAVDHVQFGDRVELKRAQIRAVYPAHDGPVAEQSVRTAVAHDDPRGVGS